jgi:hypothetical protein
VKKETSTKQVALCYSKRSVDFQRTTWGYIIEDDMTPGVRTYKPTFSSVCLSTQGFDTSRPGEMDFSERRKGLNV